MAQPRGLPEHGAMQNSAYAYNQLIQLRAKTNRTPEQERKLAELEAKFGRR